MRSGLIAAFAAVALLATNVEARTPTVSEADVTAGSINMHYLRAGTGKVAIVLLHGWPESSHEWARVIPLLADRYTVIAPDLRGVGGTDAPPSGYDKASMATDIYELIGSLKVSVR